MGLVHPVKAQPIWTCTNQYGPTGPISGTYAHGKTDGCALIRLSNPAGYCLRFVAAAACIVPDGARRLFGRGSSIARRAFRAYWLLSLAEPVAWNGISAGADTFTFKAGDKAKLRSSSGAVSESSAGEKLSNTKKSPK